MRARGAFGNADLAARPDVGLGSGRSLSLTGWVGQKRTSTLALRMSALGQKRTLPLSARPICFWPSAIIPARAICHDST